MTTAITGQRRSEIIEELQLASRYFQRLSAELNLDENIPLPGDESQMTLHIYQSILLLQWRLESFTSSAKYKVMRESMGDHAMPLRAITQHTYNVSPERGQNGHSVNGQSVDGHGSTEQTMPNQASSPINLNSVLNQSD